MTPLANAPNGYVWRWQTYAIAHLEPQDGGGHALCGKRARGKWRAFQVGGYTAVPCAQCLNTEEV